MLTGVDVIPSAIISTANQRQERVTSVVDVVDTHGTMQAIDGDGVPDRNIIRAVQG